MHDKTPYKKLILALSDGLIILLVLWLFSAFWYGYGSDAYAAIWAADYSLIASTLVLWYAISALAGLFDPTRTQNWEEFDRRFLGAGLIYTATIMILGLTLRPFNDINEAAVLVFGVALIIVLYSSRYLVQSAIANIFIERLIVIGKEEAAAEIAEHLKSHPHLGYRLSAHFGALTNKDLKDLSATIIREGITAIVVPNGIPKAGSALEKLHSGLLMGIPLIDAHTMYEVLFEKLALSEIEEGHFMTMLTHLANRPAPIRNFLERLIALAIFILLLPIMAAIALIVAATSRGGFLIRQIRTGEFGRPFLLYKFRSMRADAEKNGPQWAAKNDGRVTPVGALLRATHLDELPQLWNVVKGELAFVGPRPERPELITLIRKKIPHFELRNIVKPGITGWGQIKFGYGASVEDAREKLRYDLYYIKHRSLLFDLNIALRTLKKLIP
jgi:exopolysaccharide biosynthesis polyprenyl glycosylphosphotransferase